MKKRFTILIAAIAAIMLVTQPITVMGQTKGYTELFTIKSDDVVTNSGYTAYNTTVSLRDYVITFGGNNKSVGTNSSNRSSCNLSNNSKYAVSPVTTSDVASVFACKTSISNISKVSYTFNGGSNQTNTNVYLIYSEDNSTFSQLTLSSGTQGASISSGTEYMFSPKTGYFALLFVATNSSGNWRIDDVDITFYKTTYNITYNANEATGGSVPSTTTHDAGSNATVASNTGTLVRTGYNFSGWNTADDGSGTDYAEGATISGIAQDYTLYAKWASASSPNIVVSGGGISSNALNLAYTASVNQTVTASFNNMTGYTSPAVALYNDLACTEAFSGDWFNASLSGTTITYNASANAGTARTVYMRVSAVYNETTYYSNVITVTQAALPCTVTYDKNNAGASGTMSDGDSPYAYGSTVTVLDNEFTAPTGKVFFKWNTKADATGQWYEADDTFEITENTTLYAQWNDIPKYVRVTSLSQVIPGKHYILASSITKDAKADVMDTQHDSDYRNKKTTTTNVKEGDIDGDGNNDIYIQESGLYEFIISGDVSVEISEVTYNSYTIYDKTNKGYLNNSSSNLNVNTSTLGNSSRWVLVFDSEHDYRLIIRNVNSTGNYIQYNSGSPRFKTYGHTQQDPFLYIKYDDNDCEIYSATTLSKNESYTNLKIVKDTYVNGGVTVPNNKTLTVSGTLTNQGDYENLVINDGGQLITSSTGVKATIKKDIAHATNGTTTNWYLISSPVGTVSTDVVEENDINLYAYNEANLAWNGYLGSNGFENLVSGKGYLYRNSEDVTLSFTGTVATPGTVAGISLTCDNEDDDFAGFNLIGNPYSRKISSSCISLSNGATFTGVYTLGTDGGWYSSVSTDINPCEGFLVKVDKATTATFGTPAKGTTYNNDYIQFTVANSQYEDVTYALFSKGNGLTKINHRNANIPMLYINQNDKDYAIANFSDNTKLFNLNFKAMTTGKYTLSYNTTGEYNYLHVIDRLTGADVDMLLEGEYSFIATPSDNTNRFIVRLEYMPNYSEGNTEIFAFQNGNEVLVSGLGELQIFDVTGRSVMTTTISDAESINLSASGVYIFRLVGNEVKTQKILVR